MQQYLLFRHIAAFWNAMSVSGTGSLETVARELVKYNLGIVRVQEIRWVG
jgi:hypothetical protein